MILAIAAADGSYHTYPEGVKLFWDGDWLNIRDETGAFLGWFFRPAYVVWRDKT